MGYTGKGEGAATSVGGTTLSDLKTICQHHGWHDTTTTGLAALTNFINRTLQILSRLGPWPEYHKRDGTISIVGADLVEGTDSKTYICIKDHTSATATNKPITGSAWATYWSLYDSAGGAGSAWQNTHAYKDGTENYNLSEPNIQQVGNIVRANRTTPLEIIVGGLDEWLLKVKSTSSTGKPTEYAIRKSVNASGEIITEVLVYPKPTASETLYYCYRLLPTKLVNNSDVCDWPDSRLWLLDEALSIRIKSVNRDTVGVALEGADFMANVRLALSDTRTSYMPLPIEPLIDKRHRSIREIPIQTI